MLIQTNFIAGKMNKSVDERLVPVGEYVDALNVRLGSTETTEIGAVENSKGNINLTPNIEFDGNPLSMNARCIGAFEDGIAETIYWFVNDPGDVNTGQVAVDMILSFNTNTNTLIYHVVSVDVLNFNPAYLITGVNKIQNLLFFTDDLNAPRYINVTRNYDPPTGPGTDGIEDEDINVILKPPGFEDINPITFTRPLFTPFIELINDGSSDYMEMRFLRFAYRYRYLDGGYSATSLFSNTAFEPRSFSFSQETFKNEGMVNKFNAANVYFSTGSERVKEIQLLYKDTTTNNIFVVKTYDKAALGIADDTFMSEKFSNSKILTLLGSDELLRLYDNVPRTAQAQTIQGNRLMYGNYVDQYDIVNRVDGDPIKMQYTLTPNSSSLSTTPLPAPAGSNGSYNINPSGGVTIADATVGFDLSGVTLPIIAGTYFRFFLRMQNVQSARSGSDAQDPSVTIPDFTITLNFVAPAEYTTVNQMLTSPEFANAIGSNGNFEQLIPYTVPAPPAYPPTENPAGNGATLTDVFNNAIPYAWQNTTTGNYLLLVDTAITNTCTVAGMSPFPPTSPVCTQQSFALNVTGSSFTLTAPAATYYLNSTPTETIQYEYFAFNLAETGGAVQSTANRGSLHSHRGYEVGVVYMDEYARASTVLTSENNSVFFPANTSVTKNRITVTLENEAPYWAHWYKFVVKPSEGPYNTIWSSLVFQQIGASEGPTPYKPDLESFWFRLEGDSQNIVSVGDVITVKVDADGPVLTHQTAEVLDKEAVYSGQINDTNPPGIYMRLKASGWNAIGANATPNIDSDVTVVNSTIETCEAVEQGLLAPASSPAITGPIPAGSTVRVKSTNTRFGASEQYFKQIIWDSGDMLVTETYDNIRACLIGLGFETSVNNQSANIIPQVIGSEVDIEFDPTVYTGGPGADFVGGTCFKSKIYVSNVGNDYYIKSKSMFPQATEVFGNGEGFFDFETDSKTQLEVTINYSSGTFCFETEPAAVDPNLFYDASEMMQVRQSAVPGQGREHKTATQWNPVTQQYTTAPGNQNQFVTIPLIHTLDFQNCFAFGNGVESFRIEDRIEGKNFLLGDRVMAESNQTFSEADRFAGMTYSGVFSDAANSNNLNEFNLGLVNFKDLEPNFGPIQVLHARETDILVLQEDRISYVLSSKNVITDSTGGGAIASVPEVLGTQVARIEEYGISFNPESFAQWGHNMYFTDTKRSAVLSLTGASSNSDQLQVISQMGMRSYFRDQFTEQVTTQKLGGYDPYMNEYVLSTNNISVPLPLVELPCGQEISQNESNQVLTFTVNFGQIIGQVDIPYVISDGSITIDVLWNGATTTTGVVNTNGTLSFNKTASNPSTATITITPVVANAATATYSLVPGCPPEPTVTVIQVVVNDNNYIGQSIHVEYDWTDGTTSSPTSQVPVLMEGGSPSSLYQQQTGIVSQGIFPYSGADITLRTRKVPPDSFDFVPTLHKFRILSSNTLYNDTATDINALCAASTVLAPIANPSPPVFQSTYASFPMPPANDYLYLIWDFRNVTSDELCYSAVSVNDVCCNCTTACGRCFLGPRQNTSTQACSTDTNSFGSDQYYFTGSGPIPVVGDIVYAAGNTSCQPALGFATPGFYVADPFQPSAANPKNWIQVGTNGLVVFSGTC